MKKENNNMSYDSFPVIVEPNTISELSVLLEYGLIELSDIDKDLADAVIDYQFN